jgi:hypothetical protein
MRDSFAPVGRIRSRASGTGRLLTQKPHLAASVPEALVTGYEPLIEALTLPDPDDRHVLAAAIRCGAQQIITENLTDFPKDALAPFSVQASSADNFLLRTLKLYPSHAIEVLGRLRQSYRNPPFTASEFIVDLTARGVPKLASLLRAAQTFI